MTRPLTQWPLPKRVRVSADGTSLEWEYGDLEGYESGELWGGTKRKRSDVLARFVGLGQRAADGQIAALYVERLAKLWGVFHHHGKLGAGQQGHDDLKRWARTVRSFRGVLGLADALRSHRAPRKEDLRAAMGLFPRGVRDPRVGVVHLACASALAPLSAKGLGAAETAANLERVARHAVRLATQTALVASGTWPIVDLDPSGAGFTWGLRPSSLKSALATELLYAVSGTEGAPRGCASCGKLHSPDRRTTAGRRSFCERCRHDGAPQRLASADYRERGRRGARS